MNVMLLLLFFSLIKTIREDVKKSCICYLACVAHMYELRRGQSGLLHNAKAAEKRK